MYPMCIQCVFKIISSSLKVCLVGEWVVGGGVEGDFNVSVGPKTGFRLWIWTWTKLNNMYPMCIQCVFKIISSS
jgi:hypothetical protein